MAKKTIIIDGTIGAYSFSKQFIRHELEGNSKNEVLVSISSLGGDVDHALNIYDQFIAHGNVTIELSAFVASSATIISLGAKHIRMNENSFYLIHKVWQWVDEWGGMNEDEIAAIISKLEKTKKDLATVTLQLAKMYVKKTGKSLEKIIALMKEERWLTAEQALEWGFVDEIFSSEAKQNYLEDSRMVAMITSNGFPLPERNNQTIEKPKLEESKSLDSFNEETFFEKIWSRIKNRQEQSTPQNTIKTKSMKQFSNLNKILGVDQLESMGDQVTLNKTQIKLIAAAMGDDHFFAESETRDFNEPELQVLDIAIASVAAARVAKTTVENNLASVTASIDAIDETVANAASSEEKTQAIRNLLSSRPGTPPANTKTGAENQNENSQVDWDTINNLPHNKEADQLA